MAAELRARGLVGRADELARADEALAAALRGEGGSLLLVGEAGVGKSRLLAEVLSRAGTAGAAVLRGRAAPGGGPLRAVSEAVLSGWRGRPFPAASGLQPFRASLARLVPGWADPGAPLAVPDAALSLAEGLLELCAAAYRQPVVLALEDLHWADPETLELLDRLAAGLPGSRVLLAATWRTGELDVAAPPRSWAALRVLDLARLDDEAGAALLRDGAAADVPDDVVSAVVSTAAGLPLLVEELLTGLVERGALRLTPRGWERTGDLVLEVPSGLVDLVQSRLDRLSVAAREVLQAAAVGPEPVEHLLLVEALGQQEAAVLVALRAGVEANLLVPDGHLLGWRHALTRDAVLATLLPPECASLSARLASVLDRRPGEPAGRRAADLWAQAGRPDRAVPALLGQCRSAADRGDLRTAEQLARRAGRLAGSPAVAEDLVRVLTLQGRLEEALTEGSAALDALSGEAHASLGLVVAAAAVDAGDWPRALAVLERAATAGDPRADAVRADALFGAGDLPGAARLAGSVVAAADLGKPVDPGALCTALEVAGRCARPSDPPAATAWFARAARVAAEHGLTPRRVRALLAMGTMELSRAASAPSLVEARDLAESVGMLGTVAAVDIVLAEAELTRTGPAAAVARASDTAELAGRIGQRWVHDTATLLTAFGLALAGDDAAARRALAEVGDAVGANDREGLEQAVHAVRPLLAGDAAAAMARLDASAAALSRNPAGAPVCIWGLWVVLRAVRDQDSVAALQTLAGSFAAHRSVNAGAALLAEAVVAGRAGRADDAVALLRHGESVLADAAWWSRLLRLLVLEAALADGWGDPVTELRADVAGFDAAGDIALGRRARSLLRRGGVAVRPGRGDATVPGWAAVHGLTSREMDVVEQVAVGATNAEVAGRLHLSTRTVEHHVARALAKVGCPDRRALARWYAAEGRPGEPGPPAPSGRTPQAAQPPQPRQAASGDQR